MSAYLNHSAGTGFSSKTITNQQLVGQTVRHCLLSVFVYPKSSSCPVLIPHNKMYANFIPPSLVLYILASTQVLKKPVHAQLGNNVPVLYILPSLFLYNPYFYFQKSSPILRYGKRDTKERIKLKITIVQEIQSLLIFKTFLLLKLSIKK